MRIRTILAVVTALLAGACATGDRYGAAGDVHALLVAIRDNDRAAFDARVDRPALKGAIEARIIAETRGQEDDSMRMLGALLAAPVADAAGEALIRPDVFRAAARYYGYTPDQPLPGRLAIAGALRSLPDGRVCAAKREGPCLLYFTQAGGTWRLSGFEGDLMGGGLKVE